MCIIGCLEEKIGLKYPIFLSPGERRKQKAGSMSAESSIITVERALQEVSSGRLIIIVDDEDRENEGDLMVAAEKITPEIINFMSRYGRGLICLPLTKNRLEELRLPPMRRETTPRSGEGLTVFAH